MFKEKLYLKLKKFPTDENKQNYFNHVEHHKKLDSHQETPLLSGRQMMRWFLLGYHASSTLGHENP